MSLVLERVRLTGGTTWHAAGLVSQVRGTHALTELSRINASLYAALPVETGVDTGFRRVGSLSVARTPGRMQELLGAADMHREFDVECRVLQPHQVQEWWPIAAVHDLVGGDRVAGGCDRESRATPRCRWRRARTTAALGSCSARPSPGSG